MRYLNESTITELGINWNEIIAQIEYTVLCMENGEFSQPLKPYLKFKNKENRIIAMPAYVGGEINLAGVKWISSFPGNIETGKQRANCTVILNDTNTGETLGIIHTPLISMIRTAGVSGLMIKYYKKIRPLNGITLGIIGAGPVGKYHYLMCKEILKENIGKVMVYDINRARLEKFQADNGEVLVADDWRTVYDQADILITATVSKSPYIDERPQKKMLALNVSLRDFKQSAINLKEDAIIVDQWDEVCRENTDIENLHKLEHLNQEDTRSIVDVVCKRLWNHMEEKKMIFFNPMGMAVFDVAIGGYYLKKAEKEQRGGELKDE